MFAHIWTRVAVTYMVLLVSTIASLLAISAPGSISWSQVLPVALLMLLLAALMSWLLTRSITRPVDALRSAISRFGQGDLAARTFHPDQSAFGDLGREFNQLADRVALTMDQHAGESSFMTAMLASMQDGIIVTDGQKLIQTINPAAARLFRVNREAAVGRSLIAVAQNHELHQALDRALREDGEPRQLEIAVGQQTLVAGIAVLPGARPQDASGLVLLQNVTELRRLERIRRDFVANIGHELRTPLASVKLMVETLDSLIYEDPDEAGQFLRRIDVELDRLTQLVRELLELSQIESGQVKLQPVQVCIPDLLNQAAGRLREQADRAGLQMVVQAPGDLPMTRADPARLEQVLINLLHNAIKFTPRGGQIMLGAEQAAGGLRIQIADTGVGIPPDELPRIFERFYKVDKVRTGGKKASGTGLGLAIAKHIVVAHGGKIWAESTPGRGTTFFFTLPITGVAH